MEKWEKFYEELGKLVGVEPKSCSSSEDSQYSAKKLENIKLLHGAKVVVYDEFEDWEELEDFMVSTTTKLSYRPMAYNKINVMCKNRIEMEPLLLGVAWIIHPKFNPDIYITYEHLEAFREKLVANIIIPAYMPVSLLGSRKSNIIIHSRRKKITTKLKEYAVCLKSALNGKIFVI